MPEERGSIYKSTANEIGEALKAKLGGEGFAPKDWSENLNLLGIASEDTEAAINSLKEIEGSGERGSILLSTANAIGAMLNKKYNSSRGFSPAEWASATRKMKALETDTKSGGIVNLKGAKEVPITSLIGTINPTLEGTDTLVATRLGVNFWDEVWELGAINITNGQNVVDNNFIRSTNYIPVLPNTTYYKCAPQNYLQLYYGKDKTYLSYGSWNKDTTFTTPADCYFVRFYVAQEYGTTYNNDISINYPATDTEYHSYNGENYTANLGRTIYGGSADIVKGEGVESFGKVKISDLTWVKQTTSGRDFFIATINNQETTNTNDIACDVLQYAGMVTVAAMPDKSIAKWTQSVRIYDTDISSVSELLNAYGDGYIVYPYKESMVTDFTFDPIEVLTSGEVENFYTSAGDTSIEYYAAPTPYTRGTASGAIASFSGANTEFPFTKLKANIAPSVEGKDTVEVYNYGKNLFNKEEPNVVNGYINTTGTKFTSGDNWRTLYLPVVPGATYTVSRTPGHSFRVATSQLPPTNNALYISTIANHTGDSITVTIDSNAKYLWVFFWASNNDPDITPEEIIPTIQVEVGSSATQHEPYKEPTVYSADLGETVYGGSVDLVSGEVSSEYASDVMTSSYLSGLNTDYIGYEAQTAYFGNHPSVWVRNWNYQRAAARKAGGIGCTCNYFPASMNNTTIFSSQYRIYFDVDGKNITSVQDFINYVANIEQGGNSLKIAFELATPTEASIEPQEIYPREGVNNIWNNANGITEVGYFGD